MSHAPRSLDDALDALGPDGGAAEFTGTHGVAEVDVVEVDRLGVRVRGITARPHAPRDVVEQAHAMPERLRRLGERVEPVEVDPHLRGAILRTRPDQVEREFHEVEVRPEQVEVRRFRVGEGGARARVDWVMTRDGLKRLLDDVTGQ